jgi:UDP-glucuronate decarboxylase
LTTSSPDRGLPFVYAPLTSRPLPVLTSSHLPRPPLFLFSLPRLSLQVSHWNGHPNFEMVRHDVVEPFMIEVDQIYHLACPASPPHYQYNAVKTIKTSFMGTLNMLGLAKRVKARFLISSTSGQSSSLASRCDPATSGSLRSSFIEVYGDPEVHPQPEDYW